VNSQHLKQSQIKKKFDWKKNTSLMTEKKGGNVNPSRKFFSKIVPKFPYFEKRKTQIVIFQQQLLVCLQHTGGIPKFYNVLSDL